MPAFNYVALDQNGKHHKGVLEGDSPRQIRQLLRDRQLIPLEIDSVHGNEQHKKPSKKSLFQFNRRSINVAELSLITRQLATLLAAGLPVEEVINTVAEQTEKPQVKSILMGVRAKVLEGHSIATGMADFPRAFPALYRATVAAGEQSGHLDSVLEKLAEYTEKQYYMQQKVIQALVYPALMTLVSLGIVTFLLIYIVPKIVNVFSQSSQALPFVTTVLLNISYAVRSYGLYGLIVLIAIIFGFKKLLKKPSFRAKFQSLLLHIPIFGKAYCTVNAARFSRTFGILFAATVPVLDAMNIAADLITLLPMREAMNHAIAKVREGSNIHRALQQTGYFAPMTIHLIAGGEATGQLEKMLSKAADHQDHAVTLLIENSLTLFEPLMIMVMGGIVLFIVLAILMPIFQLDTIAGQM